MTPCDAIRTPEDAVAFVALATIAELREQNRRLWVRVWVAFAVGLMIGLAVRA